MKVYEVKGPTDRIMGRYRTRAEALDRKRELEGRQFGRKSPVPGMWYIELKVHGRMKDRWGPFRTQNEAYEFRDKVQRNRGIHPIPGQVLTLPLYMSEKKSRSPVSSRGYELEFKQGPYEVRKYGKLYWLVNGEYAGHEVTIGKWADRSVAVLKAKQYAAWAREDSRTRQPFFAQGSPGNRHSPEPWAHLQRVEVKRQPGSGWSVNPIWAGVDRPNVGGWGVQTKHTADRLARAIRHGVILPNPQIKRDVHGKTYVQAASTILARDMERELERLGF